MSVIDGGCTVDDAPYIEFESAALNFKYLNLFKLPISGFKP